MGAGLARDAIVNAVELRLRVNKVPIATNAKPGEPYLYVNVNASATGRTFTGSAEVALRQSARIERSPDAGTHKRIIGKLPGELHRLISPHVRLGCFAETWSSGSFYTGSAQSEVIAEVVKHVDRFCLAYHKANAK